MISLRYGFICDYAAEGQLGKANAIGIYDVIMTNAPPGEIKLPKHCLHLRLEGQGNIGPRHVATVRLIDADAQPVEGAELEWTIELIPRDDGLGLWANLNINVDHRIALPDFGSYNWVIMIDGARVGELPITVVQLPAASA